MLPRLGYGETLGITGTGRLVRPGDTVRGAPCPRCGQLVTVSRGGESGSPWWGVWEVICEPCGKVYDGADTWGRAAELARQKR